MGYTIIPNCFIPKIADNELPKTLHCIAYNRCNYDCKFCSKLYQKSKTIDCSLEQFESKIVELMKKSNGFKFTGGEPTLNPRLLQDLSIVKKHGGIVFLDTNGSNTEIVESLLRNNLLDVVGISLKGIDVEEARTVTNTSGTKCWDNVNKTLELLSKSNVTTILTFVIDASKDIRTVFDSLIPYALNNKRLHLKINNYFPNEDGDDLFVPMDEKKLVDDVKAALEEHSSLRGRIIVIKNRKAFLDNGAIVHL